MGAQAQANAGYAMIPRTHNLTLLVMVPRAYFAENGSVTIGIVGTYDLVNGATGAPLSHDPTSVASGLQHAFEFANCENVTSLLGAWLDPGEDILLEVTAGNWNHFVKRMKEDGDCDENKAAFLWLYLMSIEQNLGFVDTSFEVPPPKTERVTVLPPNQTATLLDDGYTTVLTQLYGGNGVPDSARLEVGERSLPAIAMARQANELQLEFPSLKLWGLDRAGAALRLRLVCKSCLIAATAPPHGCDATPKPAIAPLDITEPEEPSDGAACYRAVAIVKPTAKAQ